MFLRTAAATALTAAALLTASAAPALADDIDVTGDAGVDVTALASSIQTQMAGKAFGWQAAIAQDGQLVQPTLAGGTAISATDNGGQSVPMTASMPMEIASATKTLTAITTLKLLKVSGLSVNTRVASILPSGWKRGPGIADLRFRHLLTHTSGFQQALLALPEDKRPTNNGWKAVETVVANGTKVDSPRAYKNANFALLRVLNAELWTRKTSGTVTQANHAGYALNAMRAFVFDPAGLHYVSCTAPDPKTAVRSYPLNATQASTGSVLGTSSEECAGARGIRLSAIQHVRILAFLRHGALLDEDSQATMDELCAGWDELCDGGPDGVEKYFGAFWHGGDLLGTRELHTCGATFDEGIEVSLMVNSELTSSNPCSIVVKAWRDAQV